ncbi:heparan sulfate 2-O-sulfotransferase pipe-like [Atheta coriaria]|uniref:heparan sulfate 2-O-sulfotransferase pipe-like n=1 Tax=Dalotia coriaria TaxID=877792 RepID=UPI0031F44DD8
MRPRAKVAIITSVCAITLIVVCVNVKSASYSTAPHAYDVRRDALRISKNNVIKVTPASLLRDAGLAPYKHVTKSLAELGKMDEISKHIVFVNAVPNSGSEVLVLLLKWLQGWNNFKHIKLQGSKKILSNIEIEEFVYNTCDIIRDEAVPTSIDRMIYFVNFTRHDRQSPSYVNLIRDPADYVLSRFHHLMQNDALKHLKTSKDIERCIMDKQDGCQFIDNKNVDLAIPYFCGQHENCQRLNNVWALKQAQRTVEKYYATLGVLDELNATLEVLEHELPYFFKGASKLYYRDLLPSGNQRRKTQRASNAFRKRMKITLHKEYEFYDWAKSRLFRQLQLIYGH